jgi:hypothetical protein
MGATCGNGSRGTNDDVMPLVIEFGTLTHQFDHARTVKLARATCEDAGAEFYDNAFIVGCVGSHR